MSNIAQQLIESDSPFLASFGKYCKERNLTDASVAEGLYKAASTFPAVADELEKHAAGLASNIWQGVGNAAKGVMSKMRPSAVAGAVKAAPTPAPSVASKAMPPSTAPSAPIKTPTSPASTPTMPMIDTPSVSSPQISTANGIKPPSVAPKAPTPNPAPSAVSSKIAPPAMNNPYSAFGPYDVSKGLPDDLYNQARSSLIKPATPKIPTPRTPNSGTLPGGSPLGPKPGGPSGAGVPDGSPAIESGMGAIKGMAGDAPTPRQMPPGGDGMAMPGGMPAFKPPAAPSGANIPNTGPVAEQITQQAKGLGGRAADMLKPAIPGAVTGAGVGALQGYNDGYSTEGILGNAAMGGVLGGAASSTMPGMPIRGALTGAPIAVGAGAITDQIGRGAQNITGGETPAAGGPTAADPTKPEAPANAAGQPATNTLSADNIAARIKADPTAAADISQEINGIENDIMSAVGQGQPADPVKVQSVMQGRAALTAAQQGKDPAEFTREAAQRFNRFVSDGSIDESDLQHIVQTDSGKELLNNIANSMEAPTGQQPGGAGGGFDMGAMFGKIQEFMTAHPEQFIAALLGIPLALGGALKMMGGDFGIGNLLTTIGGGAAAAYGLGAFGGNTEPLWQNAWQSMTGKGGQPQSPPTAQQPPNAPENGKPPETPQGGGTMSDLITSDPATAYKQLQDYGKSNPRVAEMLKYVTPEEMQAIAQQYKTDPNAARQMLNSEFYNMYNLNDSEWQQVQDFINSPSPITPPTPRTPTAARGSVAGRAVQSGA